MYLGNLDLHPCLLQHILFTSEVIIGGAPGKSKIQNLFICVQNEIKKKKFQMDWQKTENNRWIMVATKANKSSVLHTQILEVIRTS